MERSLNSIVEEISQNDEMYKEFAAMDEMDEIYKYCKDAGLDYSKEEFDLAISNLINGCENDETSVTERDLKYIAGGRDVDCSVGKTKGKMILAALLD